MGKSRKKIVTMQKKVAQRIWKNAENEQKNALFENLKKMQKKKMRKNAKKKCAVHFLPGLWLHLNKFLREMKMKKQSTFALIPLRLSRWTSRYVPLLLFLLLRLTLACKTSKIRCQEHLEIDWHSRFSKVKRVPVPFFRKQPLQRSGRLAENFTKFCIMLQKKTQHQMIFVFAVLDKENVKLDGRLFQIMFVWHRHPFFKDTGDDANTHLQQLIPKTAPVYLIQFPRNWNLLLVRLGISNYLEINISGIRILENSGECIAWPDLVDIDIIWRKELSANVWLAPEQLKQTSKTP